MILQPVTEGMVLGLSLGATCLATCAPIYGPLLMQRRRDMVQAVETVLLLSAGRFISYAAFGALAGWAGSLASKLLEGRIAMLVSYLGLAAYLIYTAVAQGKTEHKACAPQRWAKYSGNPLIVGIITGLSVCPSFLGALTRGFELGGVTGGMLLFIGFFAGTTVFLLPFAFFAFFSKLRMLRLIGIGASLLVALWFLLRSAVIIKMLATGRPY
jgi:sulfite exporter TauE/SafE